MGRTTGLEEGAASTSRWPWVLAVVAAGAAAGAAAAWTFRRLQGQDRPDAQDPEDVRAVVDRPDDAAPRPA